MYVLYNSVRICILVVMVGFEETTYFVLESQPSSVNVCVVLDGTTERAIEINMTTVEDSATGEFDISETRYLYIPRTSITPVNSSDLLYNHNCYCLKSYLFFE